MRFWHREARREKAARAEVPAPESQIGRTARNGRAATLPNEKVGAVHVSIEVKIAGQDPALKIAKNDAGSIL